MVNWNEIETVLLDMDGTLLDLGFDNFFWKEFIPKAYAEKHNISLIESQSILNEGYASLRGKLQWYCLDYWSERLELDIPALKVTQKERIAFRPHAKDFLAFLSDSDKKVYLATNAHPKSVEVKLMMVQFEHYFDDLNSSHEFGYPKEEQGYWIALQEKYQFNPATTLFIDDNVQVLESAQKFGIGHLLGIEQPDLSQGKIDSFPFKAVKSFKTLIAP